MYELNVKGKFDAAHQLRNYAGKCANIHGHTWFVELIVSGNELNDQGMLIDFSKVKELLNKVIANYDHRFLNEVEPFTKINPTAENIAREIFLAVKVMLPRTVKLAKVLVWESPNACAIYKEENHE